MPDLVAHLTQIEFPLGVLLFALGGVVGFAAAFALQAGFRRRR